MARLLHRLGAFSARRRRLVLTGWLLGLIVLAGLALAFRGSFSDEFKVPGTESQAAVELIERAVPQARADGATGRVVFASDEALDREALGAAVQRLGGVPDIASATPPVVSQDGRVAYTDLQFAVPEMEVTAAQTDAIAQAAEDAAPQVEFGGAAAPAHSELPIGEAVGVLVAMLVLAVTFGSLLAAGLPLLTALIGVGFGMLGIQLASGLTDLTSTSITLAAMLGLAVGIDYALLILSRHRTQVRDGMGIPDSIALAVGTAGSAVVFAGATVMIALVALLMTGTPFLAQMGIAAAATIAIAVFASITLVPALLAFGGERLVRGKVFGGAKSDTHTLGARWVALVMRRPLIAAGAVIVALGALAIPALDVRLGLPNDGTSGPETTERQAYDLVAKGFGVGANGQLTIVARGGDPAATAKTLATLPDVAAVAPPQPVGELALISVTPASGPSSAATEALVERIRDTRFSAEVLVTGQTATNIDVSQKMSDSLIPYLAVVVGLAVILLMIAFRSILVPLTAIGGFLLTIAASFGAVVLVFQEGFGADLIGVTQTGPLISLLPILIIGVIFGLAMDYQVFLVSRMHEEYAHGSTAREAVADGFRHSARVVTAAALIMISVFAGFVIPDDPIIKSIGFAFAVGIAIDAFLIRMTLIPALMTLLGARAWWLPRPLQRVIPNLDIEGAALART
ncbi:MMPL family transporter [Solirubrobacter sp. CPCC 204708]|uniref:MMPL family transporter n=1 Tax=Solirubrobacter deserti TaxID=2282478 RepID=A0ABT4RJV8_9ACTN|nr:MMPL family transporter [Solirubrobacter deserti]MBE2315850.1 MMPL family transporter [Solirubrobacter deserti]MDA0138813.1 MMPL family transporter [Solirubrobacter deserti]